VHLVGLYYASSSAALSDSFFLPTKEWVYCAVWTDSTRVGTLIVATIYLQLIQN